jgi:hypothetical protein
MIEDTINLITKKLKPSDGDNLLGFKIDCDGLLFDDKFESMDINETQNQNNMLDIEIKIKNSIDTIQNLTTIIRNNYQNIEYQYYSAHAVEWTPTALIFRFITIISNNQFYVSGTLRVIGNNYEKLYRKNAGIFKS